MTDDDRQFAKELIEFLGEERFYHCCKRTSSPMNTLRLHNELNKCTVEQSETSLRAIGITMNLPHAGFTFQSGIEDTYHNLCRIAFGFCRFWKEFGRKTHTLPDHIHARMVLGENNEWTKQYVELLQKFPDWN
jgi:hypothetical protein